MQFSRRNTLQLALGAGLAVALAGVPAVAQNQAATGGGYPSKPIRMVVPYPAGGGADTIARAIGPQLNQAWGVPVVIENKPGASGIPGNDLVAKSAPDGYTVLIGITAMIQTPALYAKLPYDVLKDFSPVSQLVMSSDLFMVPRDVPAKTLQEFVALVKANPGKYNYGSYGNGTSSHMHGELLKMKAGVDLAHIPYKGSGPLMTDVMGGQLTSAFVDATAANPHLRSDKFRVLAITGTQRHPALPDVPTFAESGYSDFEANGWFGAFVAAGTPKPIVDKLSAEIRKIIRTPELNSRLTSMGLRPVGGTPEELASVMARDLPKWTKIVKDARISMD